MGNTVTVPTLKVTIPLRPDQIPPGLVPAEPAPVGNPILTVQLAGTNVIVPVHLSGKNARKTLKLLAQHGAGQCQPGGQRYLEARSAGRDLDGRRGVVPIVREVPSYTRVSGTRDSTAT